MNGEVVLTCQQLGQYQERLGAAGGRERPECKGQREGSPVEGTWGRSTWHRAGLREPKRTEGQGETEAGGGRLLVAASVQASAPEASLLRLAWSSCWAPPCLLQCGYSGGGLQMCLGLAWCGLWRVRQGRSSSAGIGRVGQLARGGRWLAGARSSARCRWSRGEAGSLRGIWLSCWRCMRAVGTRAQ